MSAASVHDNIAGRADAPWWQRRVTVIGIAALFFLGILFSYVGPSWIEVIHQLAVDGSILTLWLLAAAGVGESLLRATRLRPASICKESQTRSRALHFATATGLGLGAISLAILGLGLCGLMSRTTAVVIIAAGLACGGIYARHISVALSGWFNEPARWEWLWLIVAPLAAIVVVGAMLPPGLLWGDEPHGYDVLEYHLQVPREWYEGGRIVPLRHNVFSFFPFNVEMHYLLAMHLRGGPWKGMYLAQLMHSAFFASFVLAVYGVVKQLTGEDRAAIFAGVSAAVVPWTTLLAPVAYNEGGLLLYGTLAIGWTLLSITACKRLAACGIAGIMCGFACGVKLTAAPMILIGVPVSLIAVGLIQRFLRSPSPQASPGGRGGNLTSVLVFVGAGLLPFVPWLVRNAVWAGNPVFPEGMRILGAAHFDDGQVMRWARAHSSTPLQRSLGARIHEMSAQIILNWRWGYLFLPLGVAAMLLAWRKPEAWFLFFLLLLWLIFWTFFTHLQGRFFVLAIPVCALAIGIVPRQRQWDVVVGTVVALIALTSILRPSTKDDAGGLHSRIQTWMSANRRLVAEDNMSLLALPHPSALAAFDASRVAPDKDLLLIGEAGVFLYERPMAHLRYRTVFDVPTTPNRGVIDAWSDGWPRGVARVVFPSELRRFSRHYWMIPPLPATGQWTTIPAEPFLLPND